MPIDKVLEDLNVNLSSGLSDEEAEQRRIKYGYNELEKKPHTPLWKLVLEQFDDHLVKILLLAAFISFVLAFLEEGFEAGFQSFVEPIVILLILILNAFVGIWQESNAEAALEALKDLQSETACVRRNGKQVSDLPSRELVPGDVILLHVGDRVPADCRLVELRTATVLIDQASLTGESVSVQKITDCVADEHCELQSKENMIFAGTAVSSGSCVAIVVQIGMSTEMGKIQSQLQEASMEDDDTPLKKKLDAFGELLAQIIFWICVLVWLINWNQFLTITRKSPVVLENGELHEEKNLSFLTAFPYEISFNFMKATYYFKIAVALAVAAIPEGLPAVITTCLALGTRTMAKKNAIVRKLPSVETLGCTSVICSDKTGTLTTNQMSVVRFVTIADGGAGSRTFSVSGHTYNPADGCVEEMVVMGEEDRSVRSGGVGSVLAGGAVQPSNDQVARGGGINEDRSVHSIHSSNISSRSISGISPNRSRYDEADNGTEVNSHHLHNSPLEGGRGQGLDANLCVLMECAAVCNEAALECKNGLFRAVGAPTEAALLVLVEKLLGGSGGSAASSSSTITTLRNQRLHTPQEHPMPFVAALRAHLPVNALLEFSRDRKSMSVLISPLSDAPNVLYVKGAAECVLERCSKALLPNGQAITLTPTLRKEILASIELMADSALRCLALAYKPHLDASLSSYDKSPTHPARTILENMANYAAVESDLTFLGLAGLQDPPRPEVAAAIAECKLAGIRVMVITGDNKKTAEAVCRSIGVFPPQTKQQKQSLDGAKRDVKEGRKKELQEEEEEEENAFSFTGRDFMALPKDKQLEILATAPALCVSRAEPRHKHDIVKLLKALGEITAMTGDGVNDAPALKLADIGIAMGISGTEVAKEASDMVLSDDNFSSIVTAVAEGRSIYNNMKAFIRYMISSNIGEVASIFLTSALGLPEGLIPVQLLWVNLVTDGPPATALGFNKPDPDIMTKAPRSSDESLVTPWVFLRYMIVGSYVGIATVGAFVSWYLFEDFFGIHLAGDGHSTVTWQQLRHWRTCREWSVLGAGVNESSLSTLAFSPNSFTTVTGQVIGPFTNDPCSYFEGPGKIKASTLSLSVLVVIEMLNALNALSEDNSLFKVAPWTNPWLLAAITMSITLHAVILYVPMLANIFAIVPLSAPEWALVLLWSVPVLLIDEVLKLLGRCHNAAVERRGKRKAKKVADEETRKRKKDE